MTDWTALAHKVLGGHELERAEARTMLQTPDEELLALVQGAQVLRRHHFGTGVQLHVIENAKSGLCPENCAYCSQSVSATTDSPVYPLMDEDRLVQDAERARAAGAVRYCMVASGRGPIDEEVDHLCSAVRRIKGSMEIQICTSLGLLTPAQAARLAAAGVNRYNHNLETSSGFYERICTTHTWQQRMDTIRTARAAGMEICCGGLVGMGESDEDRVDLAFELREVRADSIPVNFLDPRPGTELEGWPRMSPIEALKVLAMFRFVHPATELRIGGGREAVLRSLQPLSLFIANSMFTEGYLTTPGQGSERDLAMLADGGFTVKSWGLA
jgi:biotin synthase